MSSFERWWAIERNKPWAQNWSLSRAREHFKINRGLRNRWHHLHEEIELDDITGGDEIEEFNREDLDENIDFDIAEEELITDGVTSSAGETTGLITGGTDIGYGAITGAVTTGTGAATTAGSTLGSAALGAGITLGAATIGSTVFSGRESDNEDSNSPPITFPDHSYIGPGNDAYSGAQAHDLDDHIAHDHDIAYHHAKTQEDVLDADKKAIHDFASDALENYNPHSAIGALGLGIKHGVENIIGVQYPSNLPRQKDFADGFNPFAGK
uniref:Uncharacterized protein n=1 Tax=Parvoviridae sp. TaxID=1940570 RepID=A0A893A973_9VIRU|nr:MAG: hypothetical protein 3 [Parvoviridae sp.]